LIGREEEIGILKETFAKFVQEQKVQKAPPVKEDDKRVSRRKTIQPLNRSVSFTGGPAFIFGQIDVPRIIIEGEGGLGKSSILNYIRDLALQEKYAVSFSKADEVDKSTPFFAYRNILLEMFSQVISHFELLAESEADTDLSRQRSRMNSSPNVAKLLLESHGPGGHLQRKFTLGASKSHGTINARSSGHVLAHLQDEAARANFLDKVTQAMTLLGLDPTNTLGLLVPIFPILGSMKQAQDRKDGTPDLVARLFERFTATISPLVITIDDAHWMDAQSFRVTWVVVRRCHKVFLVLGSRTQSISAEQPPAHRIPNSMSAMSLQSLEEDGNAVQMTALRSPNVGDTYTSSIEMYNRIKSLSSTRLMRLKGISREAVEKIVTIHCGFPIKSVQEKVVWALFSHPSLSSLIFTLLCFSC